MPMKFIRQLDSFLVIEQNGLMHTRVWNWNAFLCHHVEELQTFKNVPLLAQLVCVCCVLSNS